MGPGLRPSSFRVDRPCARKLNRAPPFHRPPNVVHLVGSAPDDGPSDNARKLNLRAAASVYTLANQQGGGSVVHAPPRVHSAARILLSKELKGVSLLYQLHERYGRPRLPGECTPLNLIGFPRRTEATRHRSSLIRASRVALTPSPHEGCWPPAIFE